MAKGRKHSNQNENYKAKRPYLCQPKIWPHFLFLYCYFCGFCRNIKAKIIGIRNLPNLTSLLKNKNFSGMTFLANTAEWWGFKLYPNVAFDEHVQMKFIGCRFTHTLTQNMLFMDLLFFSEGMNTFLFRPVLYDKCFFLLIIRFHFNYCVCFLNWKLLFCDIYNKFHLIYMLILSSLICIMICCGVSFYPFSRQLLLDLNFVFHSSSF